MKPKTLKHNFKEFLKALQHFKKHKRKILCSLGFHKDVKSQPYETGEIIVICKYCRKELD